MALAVAGCTGGSTAPATSTGANGAVTTGTSAVTVSVTHPSGYAATVVVPPTIDGSSATIGVGITTTLPPGFVAPASLKRSTATIGVSVTPLVYITLFSSANVTFNATPSFTFTVPASSPLAPGSAAYVAFSDPTQSATGWVTVLGPGAVNGQTIAFPATTGSATLKAGTVYTFVLFTTTQAASLAPIQNAQQLRVNPTSVTLPKVGIANALPLAITEADGSTPNITPSWSPVAPLTSCSNYGYTLSAPSATVTMTVWENQALPGTCNLELMDATSKSTVAVPVTLASSAIPTPSPMPSMVVSPTAVTLAGVGTSYGVPIVVTEANGTLPVITSFAYAAVSPLTNCDGFSFTNTAEPNPSPSPNASPPPPNVTINVFQTQPEVGTCTLTIKDSNSGGTASIPVTLPSGSTTVGGM